MKSFRFACAGVLVLMLAVCVGGTALYRNAHFTEQFNSYIDPLAPAPVGATSIAEIDNDTFLVTENFKSHLPLIVLDTNGVEPPITTKFSSEEATQIYLEDVEPYVAGNIAVYASDAQYNSLKDTPVTESTISIKRRGNASMIYAKPQWLVKLLTKSGQKNELNLLGMGAEYEWILNGSLSDKSMIRNYLGLRTASKFMPYTPDSRYCEVLIKTAEGYRYEGVYMLCENIRQGANRVDIQPYKQGQYFNSYLARRDRIDTKGNMLETYGRLGGFDSEYIGLLYPNLVNASPQMTKYVEDDINKLEQVLYSKDDAVFRNYPDLIDVDSFVDYFLINEYFANYDSGNFSTYFYKDVGGKLTLGPVWDFDGAMDNFNLAPQITDTLAMTIKPWLRELCTDTNFVTKLKSRYEELRKGPFAEAEIINTIDEIIAHLGVAQEREWFRWNSWYTSVMPSTSFLGYLNDYVQDDGTVINRNSHTYAQEITRIKTALREHGSSMSNSINQLHLFTTRDIGFSSWMGVLLLIAACGMIIPAVFVAYRK